MTAKATRETSTRETQKRKAWAPRTMLKTPDAPSGYKYRWIRHELRGNQDNSNVVGALRQGYEPVQAAELDEEFVTQVVSDGKNAGVVRNGDLILCKIPVENVRERTEFYRAKTRKLEESIDQTLMRNNTREMPISNESTNRITKGQPNFEEDS